MQICVVFSVQDGELLCLGVHDLQQRKSRGNFQVSQGCKTVCSLSYVPQFFITTILMYTYIYIYIYIYINIWSLYPNIFSTTFMPQNRNCNHSIWLIVYFELLHSKCMKWIKSTLCCDCYTKIYSFTVLISGPKILARLAVLRMPRSLMGSISAKITFWRRVSQRLKRNDLTEEQCHVAQSRLHKIRHRSFLIPHSQIWIHYPHSYLPRRTFMSKQPVEPTASYLCPHALFRHLLLSLKTLQALPLKSVQWNPHHQQPAWRHLLSLDLTYFWWRIEAHQSSKSLLEDKSKTLFVKGIEFGTGVSVYNKGNITLW